MTENLHHGSQKGTYSLGFYYSAEFTSKIDVAALKRSKYRRQQPNCARKKAKYSVAEKWQKNDKLAIVG